jgi:uncharacterized HAD superfamily protein
MTKVCLDLDDVLTAFMRGFVQFHNGSSLSKSKLEYENLKTLNIAKLLGLTQQEVWPIVESYYSSKDFDSLVPYDSVVDVIKKLRTLGAQIVVITYRSGTGWKKSGDWLSKHFGDGIKLIHGLDDKGIRVNKGKLCASEGVDFILEDCVDNALHCLQEGVTPFVLTMPWNVDKELPSGVIRVKDHEEFLLEITKRIK